jgi:cytoskeletal protein CcmA (bactofilin family)
MEEKMLAKKNSEVKINTLLGSSSEMTGDFKSEGSVRIDGRINGNVTVTGVLIIGAAGTISGNVSAKSAIIGGEVLGDVTVAEKTELTATAKVIGDISTSVIVIDENAIFQGKCDMKQEIPETASRAAQVKAIRAGKKSAKAAIAEALKEVQEEELREENETSSQTENDMRNVSGEA